MNASTTLCSEIPTILIIDDTPANVAVLADHLEDRGYQVVVAQDGEEGIKRAALVGPDLILLDVMMPGIDGFETCRRLKLAPGSKDIPVIFMTALAETSDKVRGFEAGGVDYVTKPFRIEEVLARIGTHLTLREMQKQLSAQNLELQEEGEVRLRADRKIQYLMQEQQTILDNAGVGIAFLKDRHIVRCNQQFAAMYGYRADELAGISTRSLHASDEIYERYGIEAYPVIGTGAAITGDAQYRRQDGTLFWVDVTITAIDRADPSKGVICVTHDIDQRKRVQQALLESESRFRRLTDLSSDWYWEQDENFRFTMVSAGIQINGGPDPQQFLGKTRWELYSGMAHTDWTQHRAQLEAHQTISDFEYQARFENNSVHWFSINGEPLIDADGTFHGYQGTGKSITERKKTELLRSEQGRVLEMIATSTPLEQVLESLMHLMESQLEGMMASILLLEEDGLHLRQCAAPSLPHAYTQAIDGLLIGPKVGSCGTAVHRREQVIVSDIRQDPLWEDYRELAATHGLRSCWSTPIITHQGKLLGTLAMYAREVRVPTPIEAQVIDMATRIAGIAIERRDTEERIRHMAHHDALTGLPNRILLEDRLKQAMLYADRYGRQVTVAFMDLDNFKLINDSLGHKAGDEILKAVADRISHCVRATDTVVRLGGDEFVIILFDQPDKVESITSTLQKICDTVGQAISIGDQSFQVTYSMGLATYASDGCDVETLLMNADAAMYRAKELGRNNYQFYTPEMNAKVHEKLVLQEGLRNAIASNEFMLLYQPQVNLKSGQMFGVEALIRWQHPTLGMVAPAKFIPLAEVTGLIVPIGDWVLRTACRQNKAWQDAGMPAITMSVNVSARQFKEKGLVSRVAHALQESGLAARYLELELTESLIMQDLQQAIATMQELQLMGVQLAIDDFGTGYSSLSALKSFPIVRLKIDQSFVRDLPDNEDDRAIAMAVISLGHKLNLKVIAEGVETEQQLGFLRENDCDEMQGFHFSKPVSSDEITALFQVAAKNKMRDDGP